VERNSIGLLTHRVGRVYLRNAYPAETISVLSPQATLAGQVTAAERSEAASIGPKSLVLSGQSRLALNQPSQALQSFSQARQLANVDGEIEPSAVLALTAQAAMALQAGDDGLLQSTLAGSSAITGNPAVRQAYQVQMSNLLRNDDRKALWQPLSQGILQDTTATNSARLQEAKNLARSARIEQHYGVAANYLLAGITDDCFANQQDELETRLRLALDLYQAGETSQSAAQMAAVDAKVQAITTPDQTWFAYRAAKTLLAMQQYDAAKTRFESIRSAHPASREARKSLFMLADLELKRGNNSAAVSHYLKYLDDYAFDDQYALQAAVLALQVIDQDPASAPSGQTIDSLLDLVLSNTAADWRSLAHIAQYLARHGQASKSTEILNLALERFDAARTAAQLAPLSDGWLQLEARMTDILFGLHRHQTIIERVEANGLSQYSKQERTRVETGAVLTILLFYRYSLDATGRRTETMAYQTIINRLFATVPKQLEAKLRFQEIDGVWYSDTFKAAEPKVYEFLK
jgi:TolA-binding protein